LYRKALADFLLDAPMTVAELARLAQVPLRDVVADLRHLDKSLRHGDRRLVVHPAACRKCDFTFGPDKLTRPGKCPECRGTWITDPKVEVRKRQGATPPRRTTGAGWRG
jgi:predicted Zn-ribbon and HTH transcriptional regulator